MRPPSSGRSVRPARPVPRHEHSREVPVPQQLRLRREWPARSVTPASSAALDVGVPVATGDGAGRSACRCAGSALVRCSRVLRRAGFGVRAVGGWSASPRWSATSTRPRNTCANTASKTATCSGAVHQGDPGQPVQLADPRRSGGDGGLRPPHHPLRRDRHAGGASASRRNPRRAAVRRLPSDPGVVPGPTSDRSRRRAGSVTDSSTANPASPAATAVSRSSRYLSTDPRVLRPEAVSSSRRPSTCSACTQSMTSAVPGGLLQVEGAQPAGGGRGLRRPGSRWRPAPVRRTIATTRVDVGMVDPVVEASALQRVVQVPGAIRGEHGDRRDRGAYRADLRDGDRPLGQQFQQERLEMLVGAVDLVDQQDRRQRARVLHRAQQRPLDEVVPAEQVVGAERVPGRPRPAGSPAAGAGSSTRRRPRRCRCPRSTASGSAGVSSAGRGPWPRRSSRRPPRPPAGAADPAAPRRTARSPGRHRPGSRSSAEQRADRDADVRRRAAPEVRLGSRHDAA